MKFGTIDNSFSECQYSPNHNNKDITNLTYKVIQWLQEISIFLQLIFITIFFYKFLMIGQWHNVASERYTEVCKDCGSWSKGWITK